MTDTDLDRRVAEIVGWHADELAYVDESGNRYLYPSTDLSDAIAALEAMRAKDWRWELSSPEGSMQHFYAKLLGERRVIESARTLPLAICRAIVATVEP